MRKLFAIIFPALFIGLYSCSKDDDPRPTYPTDPSTRQTLLVYMGIDNNFSNERSKIEALRRAWSKDYDANLLVYADGGSNTVLVHIHHDMYGENVADTIKQYERENSADPAVFNRVLKDAYNGWPATRNGLIVLSHASGWLRESKLGSPSRSSRTVVNDYYDGPDLDLWDFAENIPLKLDYIIFDACFMAGVEVMSELKGKASYVIGSSAEILVEYIQYPAILPHLLGSAGPDLKKVVDEVYSYATSTSWPHLTLSLTDVDNFRDMEQFCHSIFNGVDIESQLDISGLQQFYPNFSGSLDYTLFSDLGDLVKTLRPDMYAEFEQILARTVVHSQHTPQYYSVYRNRYGAYTNNINEFSGLTIYIPQAAFPDLNEDYRILKWYKAVFE